jgi:RHS repeat-associated protein
VSLSETEQNGHITPESTTRVGHPESRIQGMRSTNQQVVPDGGILASRAAHLRAETPPEYPQASYYRARYYDPSAGRFLSEDPTMFEGGINFYDYVRSSPNNLVDQSGLDGHTWGPITFYTNQEGMSAAQIKAEKAHETQHRCDFWNGNVFTKPCDFLESRGFAAEIPILEQGIQQLQQQKTLTAAQKQELQQLSDELSRALALSDPKGIAIHYYCNPPSMCKAPR